MRYEPGITRMFWEGRDPFAGEKSAFCKKIIKVNAEIVCKMIQKNKK